MKHSLFILTFGWLLFITQAVIAQPPAPCTNGTQNTCKCSTSPILCTIDDLDGYTYQMTTYLHPTDGPYGPSPGPSYMCPGSGGTTSNNPTWFRFPAWCEDLELEVCYTNCVDGPACFGGSEFGIQAAVYSECFGCGYNPPCLGPSWAQNAYNPPPYTFAVGCDVDPAGCVDDGCRTISMSGLEIGKIYYFLVDGCCGSACEVSIDVVGVCGDAGVDPITEITGPTNVCVGIPITYEVERPDGANWVWWTLDGVDVKNGKFNSANGMWTTTWTTPGTYELCAEPSNEPCIPQAEDPGPTCITIVVTDGLSVNITGNNSFCPGQSTVLDAGAGYAEYEWSTGETSQTITVSSAGTYSVTVTDGSSCTGTDDFVVTEWNAPVATASSNSPVCVGGTLQLNGGGGVIYSWSGPNGFSSTDQNPSIPNAMNIHAGAYSVTVTDGNGCTGTTSTNVVVNISPIGTASSNSPVCSGQTLNLMSSGGVSYVWSGPNGFSSNQQNPSIPNAMPIHSGTYSVTVTNASGCIHSVSTNAVVNPTPVPSAGSNTPICAGKTLNLSANGGGTYLWNGPNGFNSTEQNPVIPNAGLSQGGVYSVTVTSPQGCSAPTNIVVDVYENPVPKITGSTSFCVGGYSILSAGFGFSSYLWNTGGTKEDLYVDLPGTYSVTVTDGNGCTGVDEVEVKVGTSLSPEITGDTLLCDGSSGILNAGNGFVSYIWSNGTTTKEIAVNSAGIYSVTVSDATGCTGTDDVEVTTASTPKALASSNSPVCEGQAIQLTASGGSIYSWTGPLGFQSNQQNPTIQNAMIGMEGSYRVIVSNGGACKDTAWVEVQLGGGAGSLNAEALEPNCPGDTLFLYASGGSSYLWTGPDSFSSTLQNPFIPFAGPENSGMYIVADTSVQGCVLNDTINVFIPVGPIPEITGNLFICNGEEATLDAGPGFNGYYWSNGKRGRVMHTTIPGFYWVLVTDGGCCIGVDSAEVVITNQLNPQIKGDTAVCVGEFSILDAGPGYDTYLWSTGDTLREILVSIAGEYSVTVTNIAGCVGADTVQFKVYGFPQITFQSDAVSCVDSCDGRLEILPTEAGYSYIWSTGDTTKVVENLCSGVYLVTVTSPGGCSIVQGTFVAPALQLNVSINEVSNTLIALPSGGAPPYTYLWDSGQTSQSIPSSPGLHSVTVTDANGCEQSASILITSINDVEDRGKGILLLPNPADGSIMLKPIPGPTFDADFQYEVVNSVGVKVIGGSVAKGESPVMLNTSYWSPGSYIMKVLYPGGGSEVVPFVVVH